jgi:hypothetical protein
MKASTAGAAASFAPIFAALAGGLAGMAPWQAAAVAGKDARAAVATAFCTYNGVQYATGDTVIPQPPGAPDGMGSRGWNHGYLYVCNSAGVLQWMQCGWGNMLGAPGGFSCPELGAPGHWGSSIGRR